MYRDYYGIKTIDSTTLPWSFSFRSNGTQACSVIAENLGTSGNMTAEITVDGSIASTNTSTCEAYAYVDLWDYEHGK